MVWPCGGNVVGDHVHARRYAPDWSQETPPALRLVITATPLAGIKLAPTCPDRRPNEQLHERKDARGLLATLTCNGRDKRQCRFTLPREREGSPSQDGPA